MPIVVGSPGRSVRSRLLAVVAVLAGTLILSSHARACEPARGSLDAPAALILSGGGSKGAWEAGAAVA